MISTIGMNRNVDDYLIVGCGRCPLGGTKDCKVNNWQGELYQLRRIILDCGLNEESKWGVPCYTHWGRNVLTLSALKEFAAITFFKGSLLRDSNGMLSAPGKNSQAARYLKITAVQQALEKEKIIKTYIYEAIEVEKAGLKVAFNKSPEPTPEELHTRLEEDPFLKAAFEALTPGRQRGYILYFSAPKQSATRMSRIEKCTEQILNGIGLHDHYKRSK